MQAKRQPGSAFKPFLYSAALEQGFTPATMINDAPLVIEDPTLEGSWRPQNVTREFRGPTRLREALVRSRNLVSIRVMNTLGPAYATQYIERFGFSEGQPAAQPVARARHGVGFAARDGERLTRCFANGGLRVEPYYLDRIVSPDGKTIYEAQPRFACPDARSLPVQRSQTRRRRGHRGGQRRADPRAEQRRDALGRTDVSAGTSGWRRRRSRRRTTS